MQGKKIRVGTMLLLCFRKRLWFGAMSIFGNLFHAKRIILARLEGIERSPNS